MLITNLYEFYDLESHLNVVIEKVKLTKKILLTSPGVEHDEKLKEVIGFLEVCKTRLNHVIIAGQNGMLCDELLKHTLRVTVLVQTALDAERYGFKTFLID